MRIRSLILAGTMTGILAACGGSAEQPPVEQIIVSEPGAATAPAPAPTDAIAAGEAAFAMCTGCHVAVASAPSSAGPNLYGVAGRAAGAVADFEYSEALAASGITWDSAQLDRYLADPSGTVPGTYMAAGAVKDAERRAAIIAYLESLGE